MSATNGQATVAEQLREARAAVKLERARAELTSLRASHFSANRLLSESYDGYTGNAWGDLVDPMDAFRDSDLQRGMPFLDRGNARKDGYNRPFLWSDFNLDLQRSTARWVATTNRLAQGVLGALQDYTVRTGFKYEAQPHGHALGDGTAVAVAARVNHFIKGHHAANAWPAVERSTVARSVRDGECFLRHFPQPGGSTWVRFVEPEQVYQPLGTGTDYSWGVLCEPGDVARPRYYSVAYGAPGDFEEVPAADDELIHLKRNVDECVKRGMSDFYSTGEALDGVSKLLRNMLVAGGVQAAIAWIEQFAAASGDTVRANVQAIRDQHNPQYPNPLTGKVTNYQRYEPGSIPKVGGGREYLPPPVPVGASVHIQIGQAALRSIGCRWRMPEYFTGDASNANYASTLVSGAPFVVAVECEQAVTYAPFFLRSHWVAIRNWCDAGGCVVDGRVFTYAEVRELVDLHATPPAVAIASKAEESAIDKQDLETGVVSKQVVRAKRGYDDAKVRADLKAEPVQAPAPGQGAGEGKAQDRPDAAAIAALQKEVYAGGIPREAAIANVSLLYGLGGAAAASLFPQVPPKKTADDGQAAGPAPPPTPPPAQEGARGGRGPFFPRAAG